MGIIGPGSPGLYEAGQIDKLKDQIEFVMDNVPWPNFKNPRTRQVADEYAKRTADATNPKGKTFDTNSVFSYDGMLLIGDVLERAGRDGLKLDKWDPDAVVDAIKKSQFTGGLAVIDRARRRSTRPATTRTPRAPRSRSWGRSPWWSGRRTAAEQKFVLPRPKR